MKEDKTQAKQADRLRQRAEAIAGEKACQSPEQFEALSPEETRQILHELRVHQIELEMQNEELRRAQVELEVSRERYFDLYDLAPVGYFTISEQGLILEGNLTAAGLLGVARGALVKQRLSIFILPEDQDIYYLHRKQLFETGEPQTCELRMLKKDGTRFWVNLAATKAQDADGAPICRAVMSDITDRKLADDALQTASRYSRNLIESSLDSLVTISADGKITDVNLATEKITGKSREQLIGSDFSDYFTEPEMASAGYQKVFAQGQVIDYPLAIRHTSGTITDVLYNASVYRNEQGEVLGVFAAARDITERKRAESKLRGALADLERSNKDLEQFAAIASHDLQEPLRMVASYTQLLADNYGGQLDKKAKEYIGYAVDGAIRMQRLVNDLLIYSRVATRGNPIKTTDSHSILGEAIRNLTILIEESKAIVTNEELPPVRADASQLVQLFQNLLANAIKFRGEDFPRVHVSVRDAGSEWVFSVRDNGIGIDRQYADKIFVIFQRLHTRQEYPGTGIGLAVCKRIVERHGGKIWLESEPGQRGSTFFFTIPK